ncbi:hypothetical protein JRQ81_018719 [Phrynocephalus forsythii]|uniref:Homeobox protein Hox-B3 n=1 Tax=Phrynocephalus forsythii TaxID=171643 RepID=A0A9Q0XP31_9SAUR|nr:hypothetical protein JRQ81_018719 [Phrynocephalus forsythii]
MQKATYYDSSAIYGGYPYQGANGFAYNASQQQYPPPPASSSLVESEYHRPACSLQSPGGNGSSGGSSGGGGGSSVPHHKTNEINESCMRTINSQSLQPSVLPEQPQQPQPPSQQAPPLPPPPPPSVSPPQNATAASTPANTTKNSILNSPTMSKQIFPWMKESRQNTKQKNSSSSSGFKISISPSCAFPGIHNRSPVGPKEQGER